jgi:Big-like domain-containing protein
MFARCRVGGFLLLCLGGALVGCSNPSGLDSIRVTPTSQTINTGQTAQLTAIGTFGNAKHPSTQNITTTVTWSSNTPSVATVDNAGLVTAVGAGTTTITAEAEAFNGHTTSSALITVTGQGGGGSGTGSGTLNSVIIIPNALGVGAIGATGQFLAIGNFSNAPYVRDLTNSADTTWISSFPNAFPVNNNTGGNVGATAGIVRADAPGSTNITVEVKNPSDGTIQTATATFSCPLVLPNPPTTPGSCYEGSIPTISTLTVYHEGLSSGDWEVTAPSATNQQGVLDCGTKPASSVCTASYPADTPSVTLTAVGAKFGGWSTNCTNQTVSKDPSGIYTATCKVSMLTDQTVGVIFN